jgi:hypothetical protein
MSLLCGMSAPSSAEREALQLRAQGLLPTDDDLQSIVLCFTPAQALSAAKVAA